MVRGEEVGYPVRVGVQIFCGVLRPRNLLNMASNEDVRTARFTDELFSTDFKIDCVPLMVGGSTFSLKLEFPVPLGTGLQNPP